MELPTTSPEKQKTSLGKRITSGIRRALSYVNIEDVEEINRPEGLYAFPFLVDPALKNSANRLAIEELDIERMTIQATSAAIRDLDVKRSIMSITAVPLDPNEKTETYKQTGLAAVVVSPTEIHYYIDPNNPNTVESIKRRKVRQIAHEINHIARMQSGIESKTLLDGIIAEGLATVYEENWQGKFSPAPWHDALTPDQIHMSWEKAKPQLDQRLNHPLWFLGKGEHPIWMGYVLGTQMVSSYATNHPDQHMKDLVRLSSKTILEGSSFK